MQDEFIEALLSKCDLKMVRDEIVLLHQRLNAEAEKQGGSQYFKNEYVVAWYAFRDKPNLDTARIFLKTAPPVLTYFEGCSPGGNFYETEMAHRRTIKQNDSHEDDVELNQRHLVHLKWMFENQPELVRQLHQSCTLADHLDQKMQPALALVERLMQERGIPEGEAFEVAVETILAPADGPATSDNPPEPMAWEEQKKILEKLGFR